MRIKHDLRTEAERLDAAKMWSQAKMERDLFCQVSTMGKEERDLFYAAWNLGHTMGWEDGRKDAKNA